MRSMKIFDMHIHARGRMPDPEGLLRAMESAGIYGGCIFSSPPAEQASELLGGADFETRLAEVLAWTRGYEDRLFPVLWIHPNEEGVLQNIRHAVDAGVVAFKMICSDYYIYEERPMQLLREIARLGVPVIFHSGILWDGKVSSSYNRPLNWEALIDIEGLRFSMGHCSWPWIDECIALYGKFLNARSQGRCVEMFFDLTPGTPEIYRRELLTKLYTVGYHVGDHVMLGFDSFADAWSADWAQKWLGVDRALLDELGISRAYREKLGSENLLRFLGRKSAEVEIKPPASDDAGEWSAVSPRAAEIAREWYGRLGFPACFDGDFEEAIAKTPLSDAISLDTYDQRCEDGRRNLLSYLYFCEAAAERYREKGIPEDVLIPTLRDIVIWCKSWSAIKGELYLGELPWLSRHLSARLFRLGRLQFCMAEAEHDIPSYGVRSGDPVIEVHIPEGERLTEAACRDSFARARAFFRDYFPEYSYSVFTCHSWLLDDTLAAYLPAGSGILTLAAFFDCVAREESYALLKYLFAWDTTEANLKYRYSTSGLAERVRRAVLGGEKFYEVLGVIPREE